MARTYVIFISHAWRYDDEYQRLENLLINRPYFPCKFSSVPKSDPIIGTRTSSELMNALREQIRVASVVLVSAGMYVAHSDWIQWEIDVARSTNKPIIAVKPHGNIRMPAAVAGLPQVNWNTESIVAKIRELCG